MALRLCYVFSPESIQWTDDLKSPGGGYFKGGIADLFNIYISQLTQLKRNFSVFADTEYGSEIRPGEYDGCYGRLQGNLSDLILGDVAMPTIGHHLVHSPVVFADRTTILSTYDPNVATGLPDMMECFRGFDSSLWLVIIVFFMMLFLSTCSATVIFYNLSADIRMESQSINRTMRLLLASTDDPQTSLQRRAFFLWKRKVDKLIRKKMSRIMKTVLKLITSSLLRGQSYADDLTLRSITICLLTFLTIVNGFYVNFYFTSVISTTAVVTKKPKTIESYAEIVASDRRPVWPVVTNSHIEFKSAIEGPKKEIWQKASRMGIQESLIKSMEWDKLGAMEQVWLSSGIYMKGSVVFFCKVKKLMEEGDDNVGNTLPLLRCDESSVEKLYTAMKTGHLNARMSRRIDAVYQRIPESGFLGLFDSILHRVLHSTVEDQVGCQSNVIQYPDSGVPPLKLIQCMYLIISCSVILMLALTALFMEKARQVSQGMSLTALF